MKHGLWRAGAAVGLLVIAAGAGPIASTEAVSPMRETPAAGDAALQVLQQRLDQLQRQVEALQADAAGTPAPGSDPAPRLRWGGAGALAYFDTGRAGAFPHDEFRIDEARLFLNARLDESVFLFAELIIEQRESPNQDLRIGEFYVDVEDLLQVWGGAAPLTLRVGRFDLPFGEEYRTRDPIDSPLISHSVADPWGIDEGIELFGSAGRVDYVVAVQNGGYDSLADGDSDKAVIARLGYEPTAALRVSVSAMRTGDLSLNEDQQAELWFGNDYVRPLGAADTMTTFSSDLAQADVRWRWTRGHLAAAFGAIRYEDNDTAADNDRDAFYYSLDAQQTLAGACYAAARYSALHADDAWPVQGHGPYVMDANDQLVEDLWRLGLGLGYRWNRHLVLKTEYTFERGDAAGGAVIKDRDQVAVQMAVGF